MNLKILLMLLTIYVHMCVCIYIYLWMYCAYINAHMISARLETDAHKSRGHFVCEDLQPSINRSGTYHFLITGLYSVIHFFFSPLSEYLFMISWNLLNFFSKYLSRKEGVTLFSGLYDVCVCVLMLVLW